MTPHPHFIPTARSPWAVIYRILPCRRWAYDSTHHKRSNAREAAKALRSLSSDKLTFEARVVRAWIPTR